MKTMLKGLLKKGIVNDVTYYEPQEIANIYWTKNYAWSDFLKRMKKECRDSYLVMVDDDVEFVKGGWINDAVAVLEQPVCRLSRIRCVSLYDGAPRFTPRSPLRLPNGEIIFAAQRVVSRTLFAPASWWFSYPSPPSHQVIRNGKPDRYPTDAWYWDHMIERNERFGIFLIPRAVDSHIPFTSSRIERGIGADTCR
jgi:hypothetical protein